MKQNMQDLTEGPLGKKILIFSVPLMLSNLLQVLFNMADIAVIGQCAGSRRRAHCHRRGPPPVQERIGVK